MQAGDNAEWTPSDRVAADRWVQVRAVLESTLEQDPTCRSEFLERACGTDAGLRAEVEALLSGLDESTVFLDRPVSASGLVRHEDLLVGTSIGPWKLLRRIGVGGTASVYAATRDDRQFHKI